MQTQHGIRALLPCDSREAQLLAHGHPDLLLDQIHARDHLRHRVLHLGARKEGREAMTERRASSHVARQPSSAFIGIGTSSSASAAAAAHCSLLPTAHLDTGVHLHEVEALGLPQELNGAHACVEGGAGRGVEGQGGPGRRSRAGEQRRAAAGEAWWPAACYAVACQGSLFLPHVRLRNAMCAHQCSQWTWQRSPQHHPWPCGPAASCCRAAWGQSTVRWACGSTDHNGLAILLCRAHLTPALPTPTAALLR